MSHLVVHARLPRHERGEGFGLHVWGAAAAVHTEWEAPLHPVSEDDYGLTYEVPLFDAEEDGEVALGIIFHRGDDKKCTAELGWDQLRSCLNAGAVWLGNGDTPSTLEPDPGSLMEGDFQTLGARAHWVLPSLILWRSAASLPSSTRFKLRGSLSGDLSRGGAADDVFDLQVTSPTHEEEKVFEANPYLQGCGLLRLPPVPAAAVDRLCQQQLAVSAHQGDTTVDCTGVQLGGLLDACFRYDGPLGCCPRDDGFELSLWAPTAQQVDVLLYDGPRGGSHPSAQRMTCGPDGVWRLLGPSDWHGRYYTYRVRAYHPSTGHVETMETPDPYSHACSANAGRSLICALPPWEREPEEVPFLEHRADSVIYELHVRDFSARDQTVEPPIRGKYLAFEQEGTNGDRHLRKLADAGLTHVHLLPTYDFGSVPERAEDRCEPQINEHAGPDSEEQQAAVASVADRDSFNWGYDPVLYGVPEGSYATNPDGLCRVSEHRRMVAALHRKGLRVVADVVFNHVLAGGPESDRSVLDKCVPGYYLRRSEDGRVEHSTCMNNTATERYMMERLVVDMVRRWAVEHRVDGFRFDLMGHVALQCMKRCRETLDALSLEEHGIDGPRLLLYGEGWEFGEVAGGARGPTGCQRYLAGTGIASFNDHMRDAILGGSPFEDPRLQGFATGQGLRPFSGHEGPDQGSPEDQMKKLKAASDTIRVCLAAGLRDFVLEEDCFGHRRLPASKVHDGRAGYVGAPAEVVNFICVHDNETLYDSSVWKLPAAVASPEDRMRSNWLCTSFLALGHGVPLFHAGDELLRSKSMDRDSYNSGDWFNALDFTGARSAFGIGLPVADKNRGKWDQMRPLLRDSNLRPTREMARATTAKFCELLAVRKSTTLLGLREAQDVLRKVTFPGCGRDQIPGIVTMQVVNGRAAAGPNAGTFLCDRYARVVVVFSARPEEVRIPIPDSNTTGTLQLHPRQRSSFDGRTRQAFVDEERDELVVPALTTIVFVEPLPHHEDYKAHPLKRRFSCALQ